MIDQLAGVRPRSCQTTDVLRSSTELSLYFSIGNAVR